MTVVLVTLVFLASCVSVPNPKGTNDTLLVGRVQLVAKNYQKYGSACVNGTHYSQIVIELRSVKEDKIYRLISSGKQGLIYKSRLKEGLYQIQLFEYINHGSNGAWAKITTLPTYNNSIEIVKGKINNLGLIEWNADADVGKYYELNRGYEETMAICVENKYTKYWSKNEWINIEFN